MKKIKIVERKNLPETNSSSSHSLVINLGPERYPKWKEKTINILSNTFGQDVSRYVDLISKVQYALGLVNWGNLPDFLNYTSRVEKILREEFSRNVNFEFLIELFRELTKNKELDFYFSEYLPEVDHQSMELFDEVWESDETLKQFLLNPKSELYIDSDAYDMVDILHNSDPNTFDITLVYSIGGEIGDIEIKSPSACFNDIFTHSYLSEELRAIFCTIIFDKNKLPIPNTNDYSFKKGIYTYNSFGGNRDIPNAVWNYNGNERSDSVVIVPKIISNEFGILS